MKETGDPPGRIGLVVAPLVALAVFGWIAAHLSDIKVVAIAVLATAYMEYCLVLRGSGSEHSLLPRTLTQARSFWDGWRRR